LGFLKNERELKQVSDEQTRKGKKKKRGVRDQSGAGKEGF